MLRVSSTIESASTSSAEFAAGQATFGIMEGPSRKLVSYVRMWGTDRCTKYSWHVCVRDITRQGRSTMSFQFHAAELTLFSTTTKYRTSLLWLQYQWCIMWMQCMWDVAKQQRENLQIFPATHCVLSTKDRDNACKATREREREREVYSLQIFRTICLVLLRVDSLSYTKTAWLTMQRLRLSIVIDMHWNWNIIE